MPPPRAAICHLHPPTNPQNPPETPSVAIVGGGIAAVACAQHLRWLCNRDSDDSVPQPNIVVVSAAPAVKAATDVHPLGRAMVQMDVAEQDANEALPGITFIQSAVVDWSPAQRLITTADGKRITYSAALCIATGARPKVPASSLHCDRALVLTIRDTDSVQRLCDRLATVRRLLIVGNGGIATELVYALDSVEVVWSIKHGSISASFIDAGAAQFFADRLECGAASGQGGVTKHTKFSADLATGDSVGAALGPHWVEKAASNATGALQSGGRRVHVVQGTELKEALPADKKHEYPTAALPPSFQSNTDWPVNAVLTDGTVYGCDLIVLATGVVPNSDMWTSKCDQLQTAPDGGITVSDQFESSVEDVFAIGDVCTCGWEPAPHWIQMRLWTQAHQHAVHAAECIMQRHVAKIKHAPPSVVSLPVSFEIFTHVTNFFGFKVLVHDGRVHGAILIGETDLEETMENLILNQLDISSIKDGLLDPRVDIEDYFD